MLLHKNSVNISFLYNFAWDIQRLRYFIYFQVMNFYSSTCQIYFFKSKFDSVLAFVLNCKKAGWSLHFRINLKVWSLTLLIVASKFKYCLISRFFIILTKKVFKTSAVSKSVFKISHSSTKLICSLTHDIPKAKAWLLSKKAYYQIRLSRISLHNIWFYFFLKAIRSSFFASYIAFCFYQFCFWNSYL